MKKKALALVFILGLSASLAMAQGGGAPGAGGGQRGGRGAAPPATGPIADLVGKIVDAINKQDQAYLNGLLTPDAVWLDEDGHIFPAATWLRRLITGTPAKKFTIVSTPAALRVGDITADTAWAGFNYTLDETITPRGQSTAIDNQMKGLASIVFKKNGNDWQVVLIHAPVTGVAITPH
jgi:ketosteroid isomerase-like protein